MRDVVAMRLAEPVRAALETAAADAVVPPATFARSVLVHALRAKGYLPEAAPAKAAAHG